MTRKTPALTRDLNSGCWTLSLGPVNESVITIFHGTRVCTVNLENLPCSDSSFLLSPEICRTLLLPTHLKRYQIRALNRINYILGPLVGILVSEAKLKRLLSGTVDHDYRRYAKVLRKSKGVAVFLSPQRINWQQDQATGVVRIVSNQQEIWIEQTLPIPTVIYDRCFGPENRKRSAALRKRCFTNFPTIRVVNALVKLGKLEIYELCSERPELRKHLPRWGILTPDNVTGILDQFPIAYIKPDRLSKGKGVTKVSCTEQGFLVEQRRGTDNYQHLCASPEDVLGDLQKYLKGSGFMVVQEAIPLMKYNGRPFDFRLLLQKDKSGKWKKAAVAGRISGVGSVISSPRSGGSVASYDVVMAQLPDEQRLAIAVTMLDLAREVAKTIDQVIGPFAELGFDLGVDLSGEVKIIEVNGIPLKVSVERLNDKNITRAVHENPIGYAIYLAGFGGESYD